MKKFIRTLLLLTFWLFVSTQSSSNDDDNGIIKNGRKSKDVAPPPLKGDKVAQAATMFFVMLSLLDYTIYFILFVYVFLFVVFESKSILKFLFSIIVVLLFTGIRCVFLPLIINGIPYTWAPKIPPYLMDVSFYACTISYIIFFNTPVIACLYYVVKFGFGGEKLKEGIIDPKFNQAPMVVIMMPIYNEDPIPLFRAVESAIRSDYPQDRLHILLAFDDETESSLYWDLLKRLRVLNKEVHQQWKQELESSGLEESSETFLFPPRLELMVEGVRVTVCRFPHEGKSATQGKGYRIINEMYGRDVNSIDQTFLMFIDSDVILHDNAVYNFVSTLVSKPGMNAVTGYVTCRTSDNANLLHYLQDAEYLEGQMFARSLEALAGSVTCLPGALTLLRLRSMQAVAPKYFIDFDKRKPLHFHRFYLGEDRYMTHLLMEESDRAYTIGLCGASRCKTDAPDNWQKLIKQRRRWYLGALINEAHMLCTPKLWRITPLLLCLKLFDYASGSLAWLFMVYVIGVIKGVVPFWTIAVFFPCLLLKYLLLSLNASFMNRSKVFVTFPIFFFVAPIFKMWCTVYSIFTWDTRSWGGPRTDAKEKASNAQVMEALMRQRKMSMKRSKKVVRQMKKRAKIMRRNLDSVKQEQRATMLANTGKEINGVLPMKKLLPFPYEVDIMGGGEYYDDLIYPDMVYARTPAHSIVEMNIPHEDLTDHDDSFNSYRSNQPTAQLLRCSSGSSISATAVDEKYIYGKYQKNNPSKTSLALDVASLSRMEKLVRTNQESAIQDPSTFSYRLASIQRNGQSPRPPTSPYAYGRSPLSNSTTPSPMSSQFHLPSPASSITTNCTSDRLPPSP